MNAALQRVAVILYQPQDIVNVAGVIRVMSNFGLSDLRLIEPAAYDPYRMVGIAHHTEELVQSIRRYPTLDEALADCSYVLGTTGRPRQAIHQIHAPREAAPLLLRTASANPDRSVALLFGREQDGLPNEALDRCHGVVTIPTHPRNRSLNLAQAALVLAYELWLADQPVLPESPPPELADLATADERDAMFSSVAGLLKALYPSTHPTRLEGALARMRSLLMRAAPRREEARAFTNLLRHAARVTTDPSQLPEDE
ncbi:MAG: RNA methyltransferase [Mycobacterium leprae]